MRAACEHRSPGRVDLPAAGEEQRSEPINLGMERNLTLCVRHTRHLPDDIRRFWSTSCSAQIKAVTVPDLDVLSVGPGW
jgi:hypothetical protein